MTRLLPLLLMTGWLACAQDSHFRNPALGYVYDPVNRVFRSIRGVAGAAVLSPAVAAGPASETLIQSDREIALLLDESRRTLLLMGMRPDSPSALVIREFPTPVGKVALSAGGNAAAACAGNSLVIFTDLLGSDPTVAEEANLEGGCDFQALSVSDGGKVAAALRNGQALFLAPERRYLGAFDSVSALAFQGEDTLFLADSNTSLVWRVGAADESPAVIGGPEAGIDHPVALAVHGDRVLVASSGSRKITLLGERPETIDCACVPDRMTALTGGSLYQITGVGGREPVWTLDLSAAAPKLRFIPALPPEDARE